MKASFYWIVIVSLVILYSSFVQKSIGNLNEIAVL